MFSLACKLTRTIDCCAVTHKWSAITAGNRKTRFESGAVGGTSAAEEKCAAIEHQCIGREEGNGSAWVAQLVERVLGKDEVTGSIPVPGSRMSIWWRRMESFQHRAGVTQR